MAGPISEHGGNYGIGKEASRVVTRPASVDDLDSRGGLGTNGPPYRGPIIVLGAESET